MMRLLNVKTFKLEEFFGNDVPKYAILSHRWEDEEVTFQDMQQGLHTARPKKGFSKIQGCALRASEQGCDYCWVDTCCIDRTSSFELTEAINSMYKWYQKAHVCFALLSDVSEASSVPSSIWWQRGWTLQELIAPRHLLFYGHGWICLSDRAIIGHQLLLAKGMDAQAIDIPASVLMGSRNPSTFSIAQRMSWASRRKTTREEDMAYCLLGLFEVHMPLLYGEGANAFIRLQEEIVKSSDDRSIFCWRSSKRSTSLYSGLLAQSPADFTDSLPFLDEEADVIEPYSMTNKGLRIPMVLTSTGYEGEYLANLHSTSTKNKDGLPACILIQFEDNHTTTST